MKKLFVSLLALAAISLSAQAQSWIDLTDAYIVNPRFDNDDVTTGWSGTAFGTASPKENAEHYSKNYDSYQKITGLTAGKYRVSLSAFYRSGSATEDYTHYTTDPASYQNALFYATSTVDDQSTPIVLASSAALDESLGGSVSGVTTGGGGGWGGWGGFASGPYIPNNMEAAHYWFEAGYYVNTVEVEVGEDGVLTIGIRKETTISGDWTCLDNWKLEYYGTVTQVTGISLSATEMEVSLGDTKQLTASITPDNATYKKVTWDSSDPEVATVDAEGNVTGVAKGEATITATTTDGSDLSAECNVTVTFNGAIAGSVEFNEIMPANVDLYIDPSWNYGSWVELYNPTDEDVNIGGYYLSDDADDLLMAKVPMSVGTIPAKGYRTLWFDHKNTRKDIGENWENTNIDMKLDQDGGTLYLSTPVGSVLAQVTYPEAIMRCSYARKGDAGDEWLWTAAPTPAATNGTSFPANQTQIADPVVDQPGQLFTGSLDVNVIIPLGMKLVCTTNGSTPTLSNGTTYVNTSTTKDFTKKLTVDKTTTYRFRLFSKKADQLPSRVVTRSYILQDKDYYLPVISIVTDSLGLYGDTIGIYVTGKNGKTANQDGTKRNFNMDWDRPASIEYFNDDLNEDGYFAQEADICISGGWSRKYEPRSFKLKASKVYSLQNSFDYVFFDDKSHNRNKSLLLRNGGNDEYNQTRIKDAALQEIARQSEFPLNLQSYKPVHVFVNGKYLAMLDMHEPSNKHYAYANYGVDPDDVDAFEMSVDSGYVQMAGTKDAFMEWYTLAQNASDDMVYQQILDRVDIDDYLNYMAFKFFLNDWDWPHNNAKGFRDQKDGKFHFVIFDLDNCVDRTGNNIFTDFQNKKTYTFYTRPEYNWTSLTKEVELVTIFLNMLKNEDFKRKFIDTYCIVGGTIFGEEDDITNIVNGIAENVETALSWEGHTPWGSGRSFAGGIISATTGNFKNTMTNVLQNYATFNLSGVEKQAVTINSNLEGASLAINGIQVPKGKFNGYLFAPITLTTTAPAGYKFAGWSSASGGTSTSEVFSKQSNWYYYESGSLDGTGWYGADYSDTWDEGIAPFGYGNSGKTMANATTQLSKSDDSGNRIPTYYLRKNFYLDEAPQEGETYTLNYDVDDGMIAYINGEEIGLYHMWSGATYDETCQSNGDNWYEGDTPHSGTIEVDASLLHQGNNTIAVEVHNCNATSSDIWFDASLSVSSEASGESSIVSTDAEYELPSSGSIDLTAIYEAIPSEELRDAVAMPIRVNEVSPNNGINVNDNYKKADWIELYNNTDTELDVAGLYVSDDIENPFKYQIPSSSTTNTKIAAHGHLVIWADKQDAVNQIHTGFKLANNDSSVVYIASSEEFETNNAVYFEQHPELKGFADGFTYVECNETQSVGRYPDGSNNIYRMDRTTIEATNILFVNDALALIDEGTIDDLLKDRKEEEHEETGVVDLAQQTAGKVVSTHYYNMAGQQVSEPKGVCIQQTVYSNGKVVTKKVMR